MARVVEAGVLEEHEGGGVEGAGPAREDGADPEVMETWRASSCLLRGMVSTPALKSMSFHRRPR